MNKVPPAYDDQNIFAKIIRGEIPSYKIFEDEHTLALMDIMPRGKGHCLVIPKGPARNILDADETMLAQIYATVKKISVAALTAFDADGLTIQQFNESAGGQVVFHFHVHVIPRFDGIKLNPHTGKMADIEQLELNAEKYRAALNLA